VREESVLDTAFCSLSYKTVTIPCRITVFSPSFVAERAQTFSIAVTLARLSYLKVNRNAAVDEWKTNLMSLAILFHLLCAQHVSDINISIFRSPRLCWWITTSVVLFSVRYVLELLLRAVFGGVRFAGWSLQNEHHQISATTKAPTHNELRTRRPMW
jgi:hypothetical protein